MMDLKLKSPIMAKLLIRWYQKQKWKTHRCWYLVRRPLRLPRLYTILWLHSLLYTNSIRRQCGTSQGSGVDYHLVANNGPTLCTVGGKDLTRWCAKAEG